jgi:hypothetical protein
MNTLTLDVRTQDKMRLEVDSCIDAIRRTAPQWQCENEMCVQMDYLLERLLIRRSFTNQERSMSLGEYQELTILLREIWWAIRSYL